MQITPNVHLIRGVFANPYLIVDPDGLTLIDTGLPGSEKKILKYIAGIGKSPRDLKRIIITHADGDHYGSLNALKAASGARVFASAKEAEAMAAGKSSRQLKPGNLFARIFFALLAPLFTALPTAVDEVIGDGQTLPILGGLRVLSTPGHTPDHISLFAPSAGVLFAGDSMKSSRDRLDGSSGGNTWDEAKANESVRKQAALGAMIVCVGHGPVIADAVSKFPQL
ncbi:MAG: MBL fold metallo-hydrolase [Chloroflexota bacterium]